MIFSKWILDSFSSGILDSNAQYSGFHKQKFPGFRNPDYLISGETGRVEYLSADVLLIAMRNKTCANGEIVRLYILDEQIKGTKKFSY